MQPSAETGVSGLMSIAALLRWLALFSLGTWLALTVGCSSDSRPQRPPCPPAVITDYPPVMAGTENFAEGKILVEVTLAMPSTFRPGSGDSKRGDSASRPGRHGRGRHGSGMSPDGPLGEDDAPDREEGERPQATIRGSTLPAAQLKIRLKNTAAADPVAVEVTDFNSSLGNFAVFPSKYQIGAGQSVSSETMTSRLGVQGSEIPVTVALRFNGQVEKKVILLRLLPGENGTPSK